MYNIHNKYLKSHTLRLTSTGLQNSSYSLIGINNKKMETVIKRLIFNSIKHKNMGGIRLEIKGRLTRRYTADRSVYKLKWKGGLKNVDSSFKDLSAVLLQRRC